MSRVKAVKATSGDTPTRSATITAAVIRARSFVRFHMRLEGRELVGPQRLGLGEPLLELRRRAVFQRIDAHPRVERRMAVLDQPALLERAQMTAHCRGGEAQVARQLPRAPRTL